jgi:UDP:flavonoid glycosyltransferase YjiC (YdhE family)
MKILFVPFSMVSHIIPLLALERRLRGTSIETAFLLPQDMHDMVRALGVRVLEVDHQRNHQSFRTEMKAYGKFQPDIVVDDCSLTTGFATALSQIPRVTIQRTGTFPGDVPRNPHHRHSMGLDPGSIPDVAALGLRQPRELSDMFQARLKIVPGVPAVEILPAALRGDPSYVFSGPLLLEDFYLERQPAGALLHQGEEEGFAKLSRFFEAHRERKIVYVTMGTVAQASGPLFDCVRELLGRGVAVVSSFKMETLDEEKNSRFFYGLYLPSHLVCSQVDLVVHQCGSGTYHYPLLHGRPAVTIGTRCHDREDVALRLQELGVSTHVPAPEETSRFHEDFREAVWRHLEGPEDFSQQVQTGILTLQEEIERVSAAFDFAALLRLAANLHADSLAVSVTGISLERREGVERETEPLAHA